jgi:hypothetical protein
MITRAVVIAIIVIIIIHSPLQMKINRYCITGWTIGVRSPAGAKDFYSSPCVQTGSGDHPASCPMGTGGPFPWGKARPGRDADHSPPSSAEVKYE